MAAAKKAQPSQPRPVEPAPELRFKLADDLWVTFVDVASLKEQDLNAQVMQPRHFDRLVANIQRRGQLESLPYCVRPGDVGPIEIVSGHHRFRAARKAGHDRIPVILDTAVQTRSEIIAKQIAHNELHGTSDEGVLRQLIAQIDNVDDLLATGLDQSFLPTVDPDDTRLAIPHGEFDWRMVTLVFLPHQIADFKAALQMIDAQTDLVGVAAVEQFDAFADACHSYGRLHDIRNMAAVVAQLVDIARRAIEAAAQEAADDEPVPVA